MNEQRTPFPWSIYDDSDALAIRIKGEYPDHGGAHVATVLGEANARAILALPDLVKALEQIASGTQDEEYPFRAMGPEQMKAVARAALAKVKP